MGWYQKLALCIKKYDPITKKKTQIPLPSGDFPSAMRAALTSDTIPANTGEEAEVPDTIE